MRHPIDYLRDMCAIEQVELSVTLMPDGGVIVTNHDDEYRPLQGWDWDDDFFERTYIRDCWDELAEYVTLQVQNRVTKEDSDD